MTDTLTILARDLVAIDSRSSVSNLAVADLIETELAGFEIERLDYRDAEGVAKRALVAHRGPPGGLAFSGHMDTVPDSGWTEDPWSARIEDGVLHGLGSTDMKGPVAACIFAARSLPSDIPATLFITTDEETTKAGARIIAAKSDLARIARPAAIVVAEPTQMTPVRGHRSHIHFIARAIGVQAHSSTGRGFNANWALIPYLVDLRKIYDRLRTDPSLQDDEYDPPFSDFNPIIDNHGCAVNVTLPLATVKVKYRYSAKIDPAVVVEAVRDAAKRAGIELEELREGDPPELASNHPLIAAVVAEVGKPAKTAPYGTDASELGAIAPCVVLGPGDIGVAHAPGESLRLDALAAAVPVYQKLAVKFAQGLR